MKEIINNKRDLINWLSILRGITIFLVVMNHVRLVDLSTGECYSFIYDINNLFYPLRMPTFIMVSGALLYYTRIKKGWDVKSLYFDKIKRIGLPLLTTTVLGTFAQILFNSFVKNPHVVTPVTFIKSFFLYDNFPWPHRWYLITLLIMMAFYPVYLSKNKKANIIICILLLAVSKITFQNDNIENWCGIFTLNKYLPYFFLGIMAFRYNWWKILENVKTMVALILLYLLTYIFNIGKTYTSVIEEYLPFFEIIGVMMLVSICIHLDTLLPALCSSFRKYIFQIYLFGIAFQAFIELIVWKVAGCPDKYVWVFYITNVLTGIYIPVLISKIVERIPCRILHLCIGLSPKNTQNN